jgi:hypothetical protein
MAKSSKLQTGEIRQVAVVAARTELAAISAAISFWAGWVESANRYTNGLGKELAAIEEGSFSSDEVVGRLTDLSRQYLRELTELPRASVKQFTSELEKISLPKAKRTRTARAKD